MPPLRRVARVEADRYFAGLAALYGDAQTRLERLVQEALERGAEGTAAYRRRQLDAVRRVLSELQDRAVPLAVEGISVAYSTGAVAADAAIGGAAVRFGEVHQLAVEVLADAAVDKLNDAAVEVGRRVDDAFRRAALREAAVGLAAGQARREVSDALRARIVREGLTDALTGFVDAGGRRWPLDAYARMVARTTTREAVTQGTVNRLLEAGADAVTISSHGSTCEVCAEYDGNTYSLAGQTEGLDVLDELPPFHPNCRHVLTPAGGNLDAFEAGLAAEAA